MKILCVWHDKEPDFLAPNPEKEFEEHEVVCVHTYDDAVKLLREANQTGQPFEIVLSDTFLPGNEIEPVWPYGPLLIMHADRNKVRGLGLLLMPDLTETCAHENPNNKDVFVASNACWTTTGKRDWRRLLKIVLFRLSRIGVILE